MSSASPTSPPSFDQLKRRWAVPLAALALGFAVAAAGAWGVKAMLDRRAAHVPSVAAAPSVSYGESFDGLEVPAGDSRVTANRSGLQLRQNCAWGVPGRRPYRGTVAQALEAARLPEEVVRKIDVMVSLGLVSDQVAISRESIQAVRTQRRFDPTIVAMGFADTLCFATRVNFQPGHVEFADLYEATDGKGNSFAVMVPYVCGNVSVLAARAERDDVATAFMKVPGGTTVGRSDLPRQGTRRGSSFPRSSVPGSATPAQATVQSVPEPGTLASIGAALAAAAIARSIRRRRADGRRHDC